MILELPVDGCAAADCPVLRAFVKATAPSKEAEIPPLDMLPLIPDKMLADGPAPVSFSGLGADLSFFFPFPFFLRCAALPFFLR